MSDIAIGLQEIQVGTAAPDGAMPKELTKIGKVYENTCRIVQDASTKKEHREEGAAAPEKIVVNKTIPKFQFSLMDVTPQILADYIGGEVDEQGNWGYDGTELTQNKAIKLVTEEGLDFNIPNANIDAVMNGEMTKEGILLVDITVTPQAVTGEHKAITSSKKDSLGA